MIIESPELSVDEESVQHHWVEHGPILIDFESNLIRLPNGSEILVEPVFIDLLTTLQPEESLFIEEITSRLNIRRVAWNESVQMFNKTASDEECFKRLSKKQIKPSTVRSYISSLNIMLGAQLIVRSSVEKRYCIANAGDL